MAIACLPGDAHLTSAASVGFPRSTSAFSIAVWINATWTAATNSFVGMYGPSGVPTVAVQIGSREGQLSFWAFGGAPYLNTAPPPNGTWAHIVYTFDGTTHRSYLNGVPGSTSTIAVPVNEVFTRIYINGFPTGAAIETAAYEVDSYTLFNRVVSAEEALTLYNARGASHGIVQGMIASLEFDEQASGAVVSTVLDLSGQNNHLIVEGASTITYTYAGAVASSNLRRVL